MKLEDLCLTFEYAPSSSVFGFHAADLLAESPASEEDGSSSEVTMANLEEYLSLMLDFSLNRGIKRQMDSMR